ncbi:MULTISPECIES: hypothetical protein [unclassified Parafrankia]|uniref:hypothetical protein n=1 Tax=unclassified Parafrankia TaxID=2994368 RepID=UPI000DA4BB7F|nr:MULTISPECIES: hypothetical protein [unclassified Parafrankia]TCJ32119.1 hypothetical protein E0504_44840 [Parafrankia sp. BMG5.11]SQE00177.1 exported hypothetical protein [Parafrankia sp. Ea1.12]
MRVRLPPAVVPLTATVGFALATCSPSAPDPAASPIPLSQSPPVTTSARPDSLAAPVASTTLLTALDTPWTVVFLGGTPLIIERDDGIIPEVLYYGAPLVVETGECARHAGESGLLGLALDGQNRLYADFTSAERPRHQ